VSAGGAETARKGRLCGARSSRRGTHVCGLEEAPRAVARDAEAGCAMRRQQSEEQRRPHRAALQAASKFKFAGKLAPRKWPPKLHMG